MTCTVLCVDDEPGAADLVATNLERRDEALETLTATSAAEGLAHLSERTVDCIVSDYDMPGTTGLEFLEAVRSDHPDLPFVLFTGSEGIVDEALSAGVTDYVQRGSGTERYDLLAQRVRNAVDHYRARRQVSETRAQEHERARYAAAFAQTKDALVVADDDGQFIDANESACELFGVAREELLGKSISEFAPSDYAFESIWSEFQSAGADRDVFPLVRPDGERRTVEYAATTDIVPGEHLSVLRDVTERARLEEQRRVEQDALQRMQRIVADTESSLETKIETLLELGTDLLDVPYGFLTRIEDGTQLIEQSVGDNELLQAGESCPLSEAYCRKTITREDIVAVQNAVAEGWEDDPAYERFDLGCYAGAKVVVDGSVYGTFCFADVHPRQEPFSEGERAFVELMARWVSYELAQKRSTEELRRQNERLETFASVVSHDLRNPLSIAEGYLDLARDDGDPEQFDRIENALDRMGRIIGDLLYLARENKRIGETGAIDLRDAAETAWASVTRNESGAELVVADDVGEILADDDRLYQLLENLFRNAIDHGGADVRVRVEATDDGFAVADDGPGIPADEREHVFERGYSTRADGTGFGLYIVGEIVAGHGWEVAVTESSAGGARFVISGVNFP